MTVVRRLLAQRDFAALLCVAALVLKLLVPPGYMIGNEHGRITVQLCSGIAGQSAEIAMPGMRGDMPEHGKSTDHGKAELPCAFAGLSAVALGAVDSIQLAGLRVFIMAAGPLPPLMPALSRPAHLRPPLRGPPLSL